MDLSSILRLVAGLALLVAGGELLVRGASRLAAALGLAPLVIGLTVVAYGTSAPEAAVTLQSGFGGRPDLALGNVIGSSLFNVLVVLGLSALIVPLVVSQRLVRREVPLLIGVSALVLVLGLDGELGRLDGALLLAGGIGYTVVAIRRGRREEKEVAAQYERAYSSRQGSAGRVAGQAALIIVGIGLLVLGGRWLVDGAVEVARALGVSELVIGLTIVAAGTSLPEVATSVIAAARRERDIAVGNVIGSNLFNILAILGLAALLVPGGVEVAPAALRFDLPVMLAVAVACLPIFFTGHLIARWEGGLFLGYYLAYTLYVVLQATEHDALPTYSRVMVAFVVPLTFLSLAVLAVRAMRAQRRAPTGS
jgi:cation:H+ antiporter